MKEITTFQQVIISFSLDYSLPILDSLSDRKDPSVFVFYKSFFLSFILHRFFIRIKDLLIKKFYKGYSSKA